jgi:phage/plasmid-like protein (TIGR03299 family)
MFLHRNSTPSGALLTPLDPTRRSSWSMLGTPVWRAGNAIEALAAAGLAGWNIRKLDMSATELAPSGVTTLDNPDQVMLVRTDPGSGRTRYLSTVGRNYGVVQNEDGADLLDTLVAESGAEGIGHAGHLDNGRKIFVTIPLPETMYVDGVDPVQLNLVVFTSHDGTSAFRVMLVAFRVACANQQRMSIRDNHGCVSIRHTSRTAINVTQIRAGLGLLHTYSAAFENEARRLLNTEMTHREFDDLTRQLWPVKTDAPIRARTNARRRTSALIRLWTSAPTQAPIRNTRWAAYQAVTEYLDHHTPAATPKARALRVLTSSEVAAKKQRAYDLLAT